VNGIFLAKRSGWIVRMGNGGCDAVSQYWISCWPVAFSKCKHFQNENVFKMSFYFKNVFKMKMFSFINHLQSENVFKTKINCFQNETVFT